MFFRPLEDICSAPYRKQSANGRVFCTPAQNKLNVPTGPAANISAIEGIDGDHSGKLTPIY